jgi:hypothetical protein
MRLIEVDASQWKRKLDFFEGMLAALGAPAWHGRSVNALVDSVIYGGINSCEPPFKLRVTGTSNLSPEVRDILAYAISFLREEAELKNTKIEFEISN